MRAITFNKSGGPEVLELSETERPLRILDEVLIQVKAASVNPIDVKTRAGKGVFAAITHFPAIPGFDLAGVIAEAPNTAHPFQPGDEVFGIARFPHTSGSYAEFVTVSSLSVAHKPRSFSFLESAAVPIAALTAQGILDQARVTAGTRVIIHAAAGGVGHFAVQLAKHRGAIVTATGSARNEDFIRSLGADVFIDYVKTAFEDVSGEQDVVLDLVGNVHNNTGTRSLKILKKGGTLVNVPSGSWPTLAADAAEAGVKASGFHLSPAGSTLETLAQLIDEGFLRVHIDATFPLSETAEAHRLVESGHVRGKIVISI